MTLPRRRSPLPRAGARPSSGGPRILRAALLLTTSLLALSFPASLATRAAPPPGAGPRPVDPAPSGDESPRSGATATAEPRAIPPSAVSPKAPTGASAGRCLAAARAIVGQGSENGPDRAVDEISRDKGAAAYADLRRCLQGLLESGDREAALVVARGADRLFPAEPQSGFDLGALLILSEKDPSGARALLEEALRRPGKFTQTPAPERALALNNLGKLALSRGDAKEARRLFNEGIQLDSERSLLHYNAAAADLKLGDAASCLDNFRKAFAKAPREATRDDYLVGAWAYNRSNRSVEASELLRKGIEAMPNASGLHLNLGWSLAMEGRPVEALLEYLYELENGAEDDAYVKEARLQFMDALGRARATPLFAAAVESLRGAVSGAKIDPPTVLASVRQLEEAGYHHATLDLLEAEALHSSGDLKGAEEVFRKLIREDPAFLPPYYDLSLLLRATKRKEEAGRLVTEAVKRNPAHWQLIVGDPPQPQN